MGRFDYEKFSKSILRSIIIDKTKIKISLYVQHEEGGGGGGESQQEEVWVYLFYWLFLFSSIATTAKESCSTILPLQKCPKGCQDIKKQSGDIF